ncbi:MAG: hypothetical protein AAGU27_13830 [Dehalobacterium sp.]
MMKCVGIRTGGSGNAPYGSISPTWRNSEPEVNGANLPLSPIIMLGRKRYPLEKASGHLFSIII